MMEYNEDLTIRKSSMFEKLSRYDEIKDRLEYEKLERERVEDNVIRKLNEVDVKLDAILFAVNCLLHSQTNTNAPNSKKKGKTGKSHGRDTKIENKGKRKQNKD